MTDGEAREIRDDEKGDEMKHEFIADVNAIVEGSPIETGMPPAIVCIKGLSGDETRFALREERKGDAAKWFGKRVRVTVETIDGKE